MNNLTPTRIPRLQPINIPGLVGYYAGDDGEIYKLTPRQFGVKKKNGRPSTVLVKVETGEYTLTMMKINTWYGNERMDVKYIRARVLTDKFVLKNKAFPVHYLIANAFKNYNGKGEIKFKDGKKDNTTPDNIEVIKSDKIYQGSLASFNKSKSQNV